MQNFAFGLSSAPHEEHPFPLGAETVLGIKRGSGDGKVPASQNVSCAETIPGGPAPPTGFSAVPALGGIPPAIPPGFPIPGIKPGDCVLPEPEPIAFFISKITLIARNSNAEYATT